MNLPERFTATNVYRALTGGALALVIALVGQVWANQGERSERLEKSLAKIEAAMEKVSGIVTDVRLDVRDIKGEQSRLRQSDDDLARRLGELERERRLRMYRGDGPQ